MHATRRYTIRSHKLMLLRLRGLIEEIQFQRIIRRTADVLRDMPLASVDDILAEYQRRRKGKE